VLFNLQSLGQSTIVLLRLGSWRHGGPKLDFALRAQGQQGSVSCALTAKTTACRWLLLVRALRQERIVGRNLGLGIHHCRTNTSCRLSSSHVVARHRCRRAGCCHPLRLNGLDDLLRLHVKGPRRVPDFFFFRYSIAVLSVWYWWWVYAASAMSSSAAVSSSLYWR
jgi:hypothetical protein